MRTIPVHPDVQGLTVDHVLDCFFIFLAQIDYTSLSFTKLVATSSIKESRPGAKYGSMNGILSRVAFDSKIRVFTTQMEPSLDQQPSREQEQPQAGVGTHVERADINSFLGDSMTNSRRSRGEKWRADGAVRSLRLFDNGEFLRGMKIFRVQNELREIG